MSKLERNSPCPCGSSKKYKACCLDKDELARRASLSSGTTAPPKAAKPRLPLAWDDDDGLDAASNGVGELIKAGRLDDAERAARELLVRYPDVHDGHDRLGMVFEARGDAKQAAHHYRQVVAFLEQHSVQDPGFADRFRHLADRLDPPA